MMKPIAYATLSILVTSPALAAGPLDGRWFFECGVGGGDVVPTVIADARVVRYESECTITDLSPVGSRDRVWRAAATCSGEGETWEEDSLYALDPDADGQPRRLVVIDMTEGFVNVYRRCD